MDRTETPREKKSLIEEKFGRLLHKNKIKRNFPDLYEWLQGISRFGKVEDTCLFFQRGEGVRVEIATVNNIYNISAVLPLPQKGDNGYLGCTVSARRPRFGEIHTRGNDLHDGPYSEETWYGILGDIISFELEKSVFASKFGS